MSQIAILILVTILTLAPIGIAETPSLPTPTGLHVLDLEAMTVIEIPHVALTCQARLRATLVEVIADAIKHDGRVSFITDQERYNRLAAVLRECP